MQDSILSSRPESGTDGSPAVEVRGLRKAFGDQTAVDNLTLNVPRGEVYGLLGPNGAGKTTTLKMMAGLLSADEGDIRLAGAIMSPWKTDFRAHGRLGYLSEDPVFYPWMSGRELLELVGGLFGLTPAQANETAGEMLETVGLVDRAEDRISTYSRGMRQRIGIAQALMGEPEVLLLDEPASALDPLGRREVLSLVDRLKEKTTIIVSSHILDDIQRVCTWVGVLNEGRLVVEAPLQNLLTRFAEPVMHLEVTGDQGRLTETLRRESWVREVSAGEAEIRILVADIERGRTSLPVLLAEQDLGLVELRTETPELEDVFLELVGAERRPE